MQSFFELMFLKYQLSPLSAFGAEPLHQSALAAPSVPFQLSPGTHPLVIAYLPKGFKRGPRVVKAGDVSHIIKILI